MYANCVMNEDSLKSTLLVPLMVEDVVENEVLTSDSIMFKICGLSFSWESNRHNL